MKGFLCGQVLLAFIYVMSVSCLATAGDAPPDGFKEVAKREITSLNVFSIQSIHDLGFESLSDIEKVGLGKGFEIFTINPDKLLDETSSQDFQSLVSTTNVWYFPLVVEGRSKSLLKLRFTEGKWFPSGMGSSKMAKEMADFMEAWPASAGYHFRYIRVFQASSDFIELSQNGKLLGLFSLFSLTRTPGRVAGAFTSSDLLNPKVVLLELRPSVRSNIGMYKHRNTSE
ncbi:MAG TPA: hypothetical protein VIU41_03035 [Geobacteraceae bacterium]